MSELNGHYNLFSADDHDESLMFLADSALQSRELNELQDVAASKIASLGDAIFKDGDVNVGCDLVVNAETGATTIEKGRVYLRGAVRSIAAGTLTIPVDSTVSIGVRYTEKIVTALEDPKLYDPAVGTENFGQAGALRRRWSLAWGWRTADGRSDAGGGSFYAIYTVVNGVIQNKVTPPTMDGVTAGLAKYDRESTGGFYVVAGLGVSYLATEGAQYVYSVAEGRANVNGYKVERIQAERLRYDVDPDLRIVASEPHVYTAAPTGSQTITLNRGPVAAVTAVKVTVSKTVSITHGPYTGCTDTLPDETVVAVTAVTQGATTYTAGTSFTVSGEDLDWSLSGAEPAPGSTYTVTYQYVTSATISKVTATGFDVTGVVTGSTIHVDYSWKMPRIDLLVLDQSGVISRVKGVPRTRQPSVPPTPGGTLALATIALTWSAAPVVSTIALTTVPISILQGMRENIGALYGLVSDTMLKLDGTIRETGAKKGMFTDAFVDDGMRDNGTAQSAAIVGGALTLPIGTSGIYTAPNAFVTLDHTLVAVLEQRLATGSMKVNPYQSFDPIPAKVTLTPSVDAFRTTQTVYTSDGTTNFINAGHYVPSFPGLYAESRSVSTSDDMVGSSTVSAGFMRPLTVSVTAQGFDPLEALDHLTFDGVDVTPTPKPAATAQGVLTAQFTIPADTPVGTKAVTIRGVNGSYGLTSYTGAYDITTETRRTSTTVTTVWHDPLAQTFVLPEARVLYGVDLRFTARGDASNGVIIQIRPVASGVPGRTVLTEGRIAGSDIILGGGYTRLLFDPFHAEANTEYAIVVLTDDAAHAVAIAEMGKTTADGTAVTSQPYTVGVLLSSSNASTWTPHNDKDLTFRLLGAEYTSGIKKVELGTYALSAISDVLAMAGVDLPSVDTDAVFTITDASGEVHTVTANAPLNLSDTVTGNATLAVTLTGTKALSPVVYPAIQMIAGSLSATADYVGRAFTAGASFAATVVLDTYLPGAASVKVYAETGATGTWTQIPFVSGLQLGDDWVEQTFKASSLSGVNGTTRIRLVLSGSPAYRPFLKNLRGITL